MKIHFLVTTQSPKAQGLRGSVRFRIVGAPDQVDGKDVADMWLDVATRSVCIRRAEGGRLIQIPMERVDHWETDEAPPNRAALPEEMTPKAAKPKAARAA